MRRDFFYKVLNGMSLGIVVALIPAALLGELAKIFEFTAILSFTQIASAMLPIAIGIGVAYQLKFTPLETICLSTATIIGSGVVDI